MQSPATAMPEARLLALSPLDGRYAGKVDALRPIFSEYGLIRARVRVEIEWLLALAAEPGIPELPAFPDAAAGRLRALADGFSPVDAARVKAIEATTNAAASDPIPLTLWSVPPTITRSSRRSLTHSTNVPARPRPPSYWGQ